MRFIDFFSGIGGFRLGCEKAGHICVGHCEIDKYANKSYIAMHRPKENEWYATDIRSVNPDELPEAEMYTFGFPCQSFSVNGYRLGFRDTRGTLFFEIMRLAEKRHPQILFAENVKGLLSHDGGRTFATVINALDEVGYDVEWQVLNSRYYGVPQSRERVYIVGHYRNGGYSRKIFPVGNNQETVVGVQGRNNPVLAGTITARSGVNDTKGDYIVEGNKVLKVTGFHKGTPRGDMTGVTPQTPIRKLTPIECFRLQGFPDDYFERARAVNSDSQLYKQAGNSVTVNVIYEIARRFE